MSVPALLTDAGSRGRVTPALGCVRWPGASPPRPTPVAQALPLTFACFVPRAPGRDSRGNNKRPFSLRSRAHRDRRARGQPGPEAETLATAACPAPALPPEGLSGWPWRFRN